jgi:PAS domain S-box-containing protein
VLVEEMQEGTVTLDEDCLVLYCNRRFASMMQLPVDQVMGAPIFRFIAEEDHKLFAALKEAAAVQPSRGELNLISPGGNPVPAYLSLSYVETGGLDTFCLVITDLTEQRRNEAIVKEGQLSRLILDQAAEGIVVLDDKGKILRASASAIRLANRNILLLDFEEAFRLTDTAKGPAHVMIAAALSGQVLKSMEVSLIRENASALSILLSASPLWNAGELVGCVVTLTDITERKQAEEALIKQAEELSRSNSDLQQFAYSASHDLREPLRHLAIYSEMLQRKYHDKLDADGHQLLGKTVAAAHRMEELVRGLLTYTQAADAPLEVPAPVDANRVLRRTLHTLDAHIQETHANITHDPLPVVEVPEVQLQQVFQNLVGNALKYHSQASPQIHVSAEHMDGMWRISVKDNGIGIPPEYHKQIFGVFKRLHSYANYAGSGIGLAICQRIVQRYGGTIWVESEPAQGATFHFTVPGQR